MIIKDKVFEEERSLYNIKDAKLINVKFEGEKDGESPLKESENIELESCSFSLRYALWHVKGLKGKNVVFQETCRAPLWYSKNIEFVNTKILGVKTFRESSNIILRNVSSTSPEYMWRCSKIDIKNCQHEGEYAFFESKDIKLDEFYLKGKYSFQYIVNMEITNSKFDTKDAFWHSKNVTVRNSYIKGEYLGWYAEDLTLINCKIESHQPLCYVKNLRLIDCEFINSDLAFEYSEVNGNIKGKIDSIKNPLSGTIRVEEVGELIREDDKYESKGEVIIG